MSALCESTPNEHRNVEYSKLHTATQHPARTNGWRPEFLAAFETAHSQRVRNPIHAQCWRAGRLNAVLLLLFHLHGLGFRRVKGDAPIGFGRRSLLVCLLSAPCPAPVTVRQLG